MAWLANVFNFLAGAQYTTSPVPIVPGSSGPVLCDQYGRLRVIAEGVGSPSGSGAANSLYNAGLVAGGVIKASPGALYQLYGFNAGTALRYLQLFNVASSPPANGTAPFQVFPVPAGGIIAEDMARSWAFSTGITWAVSTTIATLTLDGAASFWLNAEFI